ncbi:MAG: DNA polymerase III subunit delta' [Gammaproteobacteria bacterium]|nr:MAG: DNA polymerase III subunit delta' [Gammaproteobacteria bacterium]
MNTELYPWLQPHWETFSQQKEQDRIPHAILLSGASGLGKKKLAQEMVASVHCDSCTDGKMCGRCHSCHLLNANSHPDHLAVFPEEAGKQIKIEQIRQLKEKQVLTPTIGQWKTVIISPAENMNVNAFNSLLKLLEEPQANTLIILITGKTHILPVTIRSRCQNLKIATPSTGEAENWLKKNSNIDSTIDLQQLLTLCSGAPLAVVKAIDNGLVQQFQQIEQDFNALINQQANPVELANVWKQYDPLIIFNQLQNLVKNRIINETINSDNKKLDRLYWELSDCIIEIIKLLSTSNNINNTLLLEDFMVSLMQKTAQYKLA